MLDQLESDVAVGNIAELRATLSAVRRRAAAIRRHLAPQRVALDKTGYLDIVVGVALEQGFATQLVLQPRQRSGRRRHALRQELQRHRLLQ